MVRNRRLFSIKRELIQKSIEAQLAAISVFNNPTNHFKTETFIVLSIISWTYLLHAYFRGNSIDYRCTESKGTSKRRAFIRTKRGAIKLWDLDTSLSKIGTVIDINTINNLRFLVGLRHEIEHQMTSRLDDMISARLQASVFNYNLYLTKWFGVEQSLEKYLSLSIQISHISDDQIEMMKDFKDVPSNIHAYITEFDKLLSPEEIDSPHFAYRVYFVRKMVNRPGQADTTIDFVRADSETEKNVNRTIVAVKETEKKKYLPSEIVREIKRDFPGFNMVHHTRLWQENDAKNPSKNFGAYAIGNQWGWYQSWFDFVKEYCRANRNLFTPPPPTSEMCHKGTAQVGS